MGCEDFAIIAISPFKFAAIGRSGGGFPILVIQAAVCDAPDELADDHTVLAQAIVTSILDSGPMQYICVL